MNRQHKQSERGFTIIEVVLVLAIAGLIFLMVFIALPALQRNQRDTQRRNDLSRVQAALNNYQTNNRNQLPAANSGAWNTFGTNYLKVGGDRFEDPSQGDYTFNYRSTNRTTPSTLSNQIYVHANSTCDGETPTAAGNRKIAFTMKLEGGGVACINN